MVDCYVLDNCNTSEFVEDILSEGAQVRQRVSSGGCTP